MRSGGDMKEAKGRWPNCGPQLNLMSSSRCDAEGWMEIADCLLQGRWLQFT